MIRCILRFLWKRDGRTAATLILYLDEYLTPSQRIIIRDFFAGEIAVDAVYAEEEAQRINVSGMGVVK